MELNLPRLYQAIPSEAGGIVTHLKTTANPTSSGKTRDSVVALPLRQSLSLQKLGRKKLGHSGLTQLIQLKGVRESGIWPHVPSWTLDFNPGCPTASSTQEPQGREERKKGLDPFSDALFSSVTNCKLLSYTLEKQPG